MPHVLGLPNYAKARSHHIAMKMMGSFEECEMPFRLSYAGQRVSHVSHTLLLQLCVLATGLPC